MMLTHAKRSQLIQFKVHENETLKMKGEKQMFQVNARIFKIMICSIIIALNGLTGYGLAHADNPVVSRAVFFVG